MGYQNWNTSENQRFSDRNYTTQDVDDYSLMDSQSPENYNNFNRYDQSSSNMRGYGQHGTIGRASYGKNPYEQRYSEYPGSFSSDSNRSRDRYNNDSGRNSYEPSYNRVITEAVFMMIWGIRISQEIEAPITRCVTAMNFTEEEAMTKCLTKAGDLEVD